MRYRSRTLLIGLSVVAVFLGLCGLYVRQMDQQQRIAEQQLEIAELKLTIEALRLTQQPDKIVRVENSQRPIVYERVSGSVPPTDKRKTSHIGVPWAVERAMLIDGARPVWGMQRGFESEIEIEPYSEPFEQPSGSELQLPRE